MDDALENERVEARLGAPADQVAIVELAATVTMHLDHGSARLWPGRKLNSVDLESDQKTGFVTQTSATRPMPPHIDVLRWDGEGKLKHDPARRQIEHYLDATILSEGEGDPPARDRAFAT